MDYKNLSLIELSELIQDKKTTSAEIYKYFLDRALKYNDELNAFNTLPTEELSRSSTIPLKGGECEPSNLPTFQPSNPPLPIAVKDLFCEK